MTMIVENLNQVRQQIKEAALKAGRNPEDVTLIAVTKTISVDRIQEVVAQGISNLGENRPQELVEKLPQLDPALKWHLIGHLQRNKVKYIFDKVALIHSLDSWRLAEEIHERATAKQIQVPVLIQVNVSGEGTKYGLAPKELPEFAQQIASLSGIKVKGLMTMAPHVSNPEEVRPVFRELKHLATQLAQANIVGIEMQQLSMGMSNDYTVAIEEGATMVRVGSQIFGSRYNTKGGTK